MELNAALSMEVYAADTTQETEGEGAAPTEEKAVQVQTKAVQTRQPKQPAAKKTSAQRHRNRQHRRKHRNRNQ